MTKGNNLFENIVEIFFVSFKNCRFAKIECTIWYCCNCMNMYASIQKYLSEQILIYIYTDILSNSVYILYIHSNSKIRHLSNKPRSRKCFWSGYIWWHMTPRDIPKYQKFVELKLKIVTEIIMRSQIKPSWIRIRFLVGIYIFFLLCAKCLFI